VGLWLSIGGADAAHVGEAAVSKGENQVPEGFGIDVGQAEAVVLAAADGFGVVEGETVFGAGFADFIFGDAAGLGFGAEVGFEGFAGFAELIEEVGLEAFVVVLRAAAETDFAAGLEDVVMAEEIGIGQEGILGGVLTAAAGEGGLAPVEPGAELGEVGFLGTDEGSAHGVG
jgi:hypothetical protein